MAGAFCAAGVGIGEGGAEAGGGGVAEDDQDAVGHGGVS